MLGIVYILLYVYLVNIITVYAQYSSMVILHAALCMFMSITSPLYNIIYYIKLKIIIDMTR